MTYEEAINRIVAHIQVHGIGEYPHVKIGEALNMALDALRMVDTLQNTRHLVIARDLTESELAELQEYMRNEPPFILEPGEEILAITPKVSTMVEQDEKMRLSKKIRELLGNEELLCQLAEEASELSQAALKMRRCINGKNPTPVTLEEATANLIEEISDVCNVIGTMDMWEPNREAIRETAERKTNRWYGRIVKDRSEKQDNPEEVKA